MGLSPHEFYSMSWVDYTRASQGYIIRQCRYMEGVRKAAFFTVLMNADPKKSRHLKEEKLFRLVTDGPVKVQKVKEKQLTPEEWQAILKRYKFI